MTPALVALCPFLLLGLMASAQSPGNLLNPPLCKGLVVEQIVKNSEGAIAGMKPGDVLSSWARGNERGRLESPFELHYVWLEQASRGPVTIEGIRRNARRTWMLGANTWGISVRPNFSESLLARYREAQELVSAGKTAEAIERFRAVALASTGQGVAWLPSWILSHAGQILLDAQQWEVFDSICEDAIQQAHNLGPMIRAQLLRQWALGFESRDDLTSADARTRDALLEWEKLGHEQVTVANTLLSLAVIDLKRGDLNSAEDHLQRAAALEEKLAPGGIQAIVTLINFAVLYQDKGQLEKAEEYYFRTLDKEEKHFPATSMLAQTLSDLAVLYDQQGDLTRAESYYRKSLGASLKLDAESLVVADTLSDLAECLLERGEFVQADSYQRKALLIRTKKAPGGLDTAYSLAGLGKIARTRGKLAEAERFYQQAFAIADKIAAPSRDRARFLMGLGAVLRDRRDYPQAEKLYRESLSIIEQEDPGSIDRADILADLAATIYHQNQPDMAAHLYRQALDILEKKAFQLAGREEDRSRYRAQHVRYYHEYMRVLMEQGHTEHAFEILEASHARTLLEMLSHSGVNVGQGVDSGLLQRERELQQLINSKAEDRIRLGSATANAQTSVLDHEVANLLLEHGRVEAEIRVGSPSYAALTQPHPLGSREIQALLDDNTLLLEYSLGEEHSYVWAVTNTSLSAYQLPKRLQIEAGARCVYWLLTAQNRPSKNALDTSKVAQEAYGRAAASLSHMVLGPVAALLGNKRLLIVADGALQYIPFAALPAPETRSGSMPLVAKHEIVSLPSASVLAELRHQRVGRPSASRAVVVLADPVFDRQDERLQPGRPGLASLPGALVRNAVTRAADDLGLTRNGKVSLNRLLYTRKEAQAVMSVTPAGRGMAALDFQASRSLATSPGLSRYGIVHFATHGILDNKHPELSGLVLSLVDQRGEPQDGFLTLQDIYNLKLPVDLVVLSGCETGLGEQINGEGLLSLTRGFMYAGATRVVASLWNVSDMATASLMAEFYRAMLRDGMRPSAALRRAQIYMWRQKQWKSPYYWAAFQIQGEWQ